VALRLALLAYAVAIGRSLIDWGYVYPELGFTQPWSVFGALVFYSAAFGLWSWGLIGLARRERVGAWVVLVLTTLFGGVLGIGTIVAFCPVPCEVLSPIGDLWNLTTTVTSIAAIVAIARDLRR
jgi:hypothetical protein